MPEDHSQVDIVYRSPGTTSPIFHTDRDCCQLESAPVPRAREDIPDRWRVCDRCRYRHVPTLEDASAGRATIDPVATTLLVIGTVALMIVATLFVGVVGGVL